MGLRFGQAGLRFSQPGPRLVEPGLGADLLLHRNLIVGLGPVHRFLRRGPLRQQVLLPPVLGLVLGDGGIELRDRGLGLRDGAPRRLDPRPGRLDLLL